MEIKAKLIDMNTLADNSFSKWIPMTLPEGALVLDLLPVLKDYLYSGNGCGKPETDARDTEKNCENAPAFIINGQSAGLHTKLKEGDNVTILQVILMGG